MHDGVTIMLLICIMYCYLQVFRRIRLTSRLRCFKLKFRSACLTKHYKLLARGSWVESECWTPCNCEGMVLHRLGPYRSGGEGSDSAWSLKHLYIYIYTYNQGLFSTSTAWKLQISQKVTGAKNQFLAICGFQRWFQVLGDASALGLEGFLGSSLERFRGSWREGWEVAEKGYPNAALLVSDHAGIDYQKPWKC